MSKLKLVQAGSGSPRPLVIVYHAGLDPALLTNALPPNACVLTDIESKYDALDLPNTPENLPAAVAFAQAATGEAFQASPVVLAAWSAGCQAIRSQLIAGYDADAVVCADGIHSATQPDVAQQIVPWRTYFDRARAGERTALVSHSSIEPAGFNSVARTLALITGQSFDQRGPPEAPVVQRDGNFVIYSSTGEDAPAHIAQARVVLPRMLADMAALPATTPSHEAAMLVAALIGGAAVGYVAARYLLGWWQ